ncbi:MAG TPA: TadE/TadG family type IV pilus assembly protein, partial [Propionibacteriaceae bacterium]|nr:TadE/TadG family type IV pilus assembly protein [Propionibacteriaceae bacterium]
MRLRGWPAARRHRQDRESGQATAEFALILIPLLTVVGGIIYFGIGLNYWLDMNRAANQGARSAAVDNWPAQCARTETSCTNSSSLTSCSTVLAAGSRAKLQDVVRCLPRNNPTVSICYPGKTALTATIGDPVKVTLTAPYKFFFVKSIRITLTASATMRLEQLPK